MGFQSLMRTLLRDQKCFYSDSAATQLLNSQLEVAQVELKAALHELKRTRMDLKVAYQAFAKLDKMYKELAPQAEQPVKSGEHVEQLETLVEEKEGQ
jgi:hypothetical protein